MANIEQNIEENVEKIAEISENRQENVESTILPAYNGIPYEVIDFFEVPHHKVDGEAEGPLRDIYRYFKKKMPKSGISEILSQLSSVRNRIGAPSLTDNTYHKIWRWVRLQENIEETQRRRMSGRIDGRAWNKLANQEDDFQRKQKVLEGE